MAKKVTNRMYQLYELRDNLEATIENLKMLMRQYGHLVELIIPSKYHDEMKDFIKGIVEDGKRYEAKLKDYTERLAKVKRLIEIYEKKDEQSDFLVSVITDFIEAMNLASGEAPTNA